MKSKTKLNAVWISACMIGCMGIPSHAVEPGNNPSYTIEIPTSIPIAEIAKTEESSISSTPFTVSASALVHMDNKKVEVTISTDKERFELTDANSHALPYQVYNQSNGGEPLAKDAVFATFSQVGDVNGRIDIDQKNIIAAGEYTGTITFTITTKDING